MSSEPHAARPPVPDPMSSTGPGTTPGSLPMFLSTEHWSLLGTRSMTWSEVMSRITIHLTVMSAFLVALALVAQSSGFGHAFRVLSIGLASAALVMGSLTAVRVNMASREDADLVRAMNRIRTAYLELEPGMAPYLSAGTHDDDRGIMHTYSLGRPRNIVLHVIGSTAFFVMVVNILVAGTLGALVASAAGGSTTVVVVSGIALAGAYAAASLSISMRIFTRPEVEVRFPSPEAPQRGRRP